MDLCAAMRAPSERRRSIGHTRDLSTQEGHNNAFPTCLGFVIREYASITITLAYVRVSGPSPLQNRRKSFRRWLTRFMPTVVSNLYIIHYTSLCLAVTCLF